MAAGIERNPRRARDRGPRRWTRAAREHAPAHPAVHGLAHGRGGGRVRSATSKPPSPNSPNGKTDAARSPAGEARRGDPRRGALTCRTEYLYGEDPAVVTLLELEEAHGRRTGPAVASTARSSLSSAWAPASGAPVLQPHLLRRRRSRTPSGSRSGAPRRTSACSTATSGPTDSARRRYREGARAGCRVHPYDRRRSRGRPRDRTGGSWCRVRGPGARRERSRSPPTLLVLSTGIVANPAERLSRSSSRSR